MSHVNATRLSQVNFRAPDLDQMQNFLTEFGLLLGSRDAQVLRMSGHGDFDCIHLTELGEPAFVGFGLEVADDDALDHLAFKTGKKVDDTKHKRTLFLCDPNGYEIAVTAESPETRTPSEHSAPKINYPNVTNRISETMRRLSGPSHVLRLGHVVLNVASFRESESWYKSHFGFLTSDEIELEPGVSVGAFMRLNIGNTATDHHSLFLLEAPGDASFNHAAFEVSDVDDLMVGHDHLRKNGREHSWGVGRHILGSQVFDYWKDPWGHELEHFSDGDRFVASNRPNVATLDDLLGVQWGDIHPLMRAAEEIEL